MFKVVFKATPGVFGDKGFNKTPGLLFVFDISVNPAQRVQIFTKSLSHQEISVP